MVAILSKLFLVVSKFFSRVVTPPFLRDEALSLALYNSIHPCIMIHKKLIFHAMRFYTHHLPWLEYSHWTLIFTSWVVQPLIFLEKILGCFFDIDGHLSSQSYPKFLGCLIYCWTGGICFRPLVEPSRIFGCIGYTYFCLYMIFFNSWLGYHNFWMSLDEPHSFCHYGSLALVVFQYLKCYFQLLVV